MERKKLNFPQEEWKKLGEKAKGRSLLDGGLAHKVWTLANNYYARDAFAEVWDALTKMYGKLPTQVHTLEEFWTPKLQKTVKFLVGKERLEDIMELSRMQLEGQFSKSMWRKSYRSKDVGYHASNLITSLAGWIYWCYYGLSAEELLTYEHDWCRGYVHFLALEIRRENPKVLEQMREAILGENQQVLLSRVMIRAIIISGQEEMVDLLLKLLVAAKLQEGLRQSILESADEGSTETMKKIIKVCLDEDLFRYSSATRAFDTWTGLGYGDAKPAVVKKCAAFAYECLEDKEVRMRYLDSENNLEAYFAMWSMGCYEIEDTDEMARKLLDDPKKYRRILGWLFVSRTDNADYKMHLASSYLEERDEETLAWIINNLTFTQSLMSCYSYNRTDWTRKPAANSAFPQKAAERKALFAKLKEIVEYIGNKNRTFTGNPLAFVSVTLENTPVMRCMISLAGYDMDTQMIEELHGLLPLMDVDRRRAFYVNLLEPEKNLLHREYLREALDDRSIHVKELAVQRLSACNLLEDDLHALAQSLRSKSSGLRKAVMTILDKQSMRKLQPVLEHLLQSGENNQIQAGIELILLLKKEHPEVLEEQKEALEKLKTEKLTTQTEILLQQLQVQETAPEEVYTLENGYGLYDPTVTKELEEQPENPDIFNLKELKSYFPTAEEYGNLIANLNAVFEKHADYEYEVIYWDDSRVKVLFGDAAYGNIRIPAEFGKHSYYVTGSNTLRIEMIPFHEEFLEAMYEYTTNIPKMLGLCYCAARWNDQMLSNQENLPWFQSILDQGISMTYHNWGYQTYKQRYWQMMDIIRLLPQVVDEHECFVMASKFQRSIIQLIGRENLDKNYVQEKKDSRILYASGKVERYVTNHKAVAYWRKIMQSCTKNETDFREWVLEEFRQEHQLLEKGVTNAMPMEDYFRAVDAHILPKDALAEKILFSGSSESDIRALTAPNKFNLRGKKLYDTYPWVKAFVDELILRIVQVEEKRGELPTPLTKDARAIERFEGAEHFCNLLAALGKETFFRGYEYSHDHTKKAILSRLLKRCYPAKEDTPQSLEKALKQTDIKEKRLAEAVMYAPQWAGFAEEIMKWTGLKCAVWFFHAHINETFSAEKETEVAMYSPITPQQFNDGAFDKEWFMQAYAELGEKRFQILYKSAKYITSGSNQHRRSQLYSDAVLGKLDAASLKQEIIDKRNQEKLRCYPLIPIGENQPDEALRRYEFLQKFLKESKQFGSQRKESEKKAVHTAMENLAITTGFMDVNRMTWYLESEKMEEIRPLMEPQEIEGVQLWLEIGADGTAELAIAKNGKRQKSLPKTLNKNETVLELKTVIKDLKEQKRRAKESLEKAMMESTGFGAEELTKLLDNPVLSPMITSLVWTCDSVNGFLKKEHAQAVLCDLQGVDHPLTQEVRVAHPYDLMQAGEWASYMKVLYERRQVQPFKQVFREYYPITEDERQEKTISRRYAGNQVQPKKTVALLKGRGWTVDYEEGLQKVYYKENLIVRMYALADWFSPADIEAPTLETIQFYDRKTGKAVEMETIPPILFSEAMRDMDLVVSVAHVGGVDPEVSHSTIEMRLAIAEELLKLLRITNVEFVGSHAKIKGSLGEYSVHMGSGVVHAQAKGMIPIIPVHSQARGRIFLPFADEDPKTQEIMSKILLLAEDKKIKDPEILRMLA